jgi:hypothetical protein
VQWGAVLGLLPNACSLFKRVECRESFRCIYYSGVSSDLSYLSDFVSVIQLLQCYYLKSVKNENLVFYYVSMLRTASDGRISLIDTLQRNSGWCVVILKYVRLCSVSYIIAAYRIKKTILMFLTLTA